MSVISAKALELFGGAVTRSGTDVEISWPEALRSDAMDALVVMAVFGDPADKEGARTIADAISKLGNGSTAREAYVCGGGGHNGNLMALLRQFAPDCRWDRTDTLGVPADWVEAVAFAWLAFRLIERQPANVPQVTGAAGPRLLGAIYPA